MSNATTDHPDLHFAQSNLRGARRLLEQAAELPEREPEHLRIRLPLLWQVADALQSAAACLDDCGAWDRQAEVWRRIAGLRGLFVTPEFEVRARGPLYGELNAILCALESEAHL